MIRPFRLICYGIAFSFGVLSAQNIQLTRLMPTVHQFGSSSQLGFAGGLNSPQFSSADLNQDGASDLFVFDRVGNVSLAFVRLPNGTYQLAQDLLVNFPPLEAWVLLRDFNNDGAVDIFTYNRNVASGIKVYQGFYTNTGLLDFTRFTFGNELDIIFFPTQNGQPTQLYVSDIDYPSISDVDCDGDLDVLTFNIGGGFIEFYQNRSVENGHSRDSLQFILADNCYGGVYESGISTTLDLASAPGECANGIVAGGVEPRHVGSTLLSLDEDGDGDQDLILGDLSFPNLNRSTNANGCSLAWMNEQDAHFPAYDVPVDLPIFPAAYYLDIDGDGVRDFIAAPNPNSNGVDHENVWYYRNAGTDASPELNFQKNDFLVKDMIDVGTRSKPARLDYNADGRMDLVVANFSYFELFGIKNTRLLLYENTGTATSPVFTLVDEDFLGLNQYSSDQTGAGTFDLAPTFGDLDGDGDVDALIGEIGGRLFYAENLAGANQPVNFAPAVFGFQDIDIGQASTPQIIDLNRDGLGDIVIGEKNGNVNYFQNVGSVGNAVFGNNEELLPNVKNLGQVDTRIPGYSTGYASPYFVDLAGAYRLFVGTEFGTVEVYTDIEGHLDGSAFTLVAETIPGLAEGAYLHTVLYDWNNNGFLDMVIGNERGGLGFFATNILLDGTVPTAELPEPTLFRLYPNPVNDQLQVALANSSPATIMLSDQLGRPVRQWTTQQLLTVLDVSDLPAGLYYLRLTQNSAAAVRKVVIE